MIAGLDRPTGGRVRVNGHEYRDSAAPMGELGILLEAKAVHTGRSARNHLLALAQTNGLGRRRVDEVIDMVGLGEVADKRVGGFSLGMGQRLGVASALLGDPQVVVLDEPVNGLDPEGVLWVRTLTRRLAAEGRTVFLSSHLMSEMAQTADHLIVLGRGRVITDAPVSTVLAMAKGDAVRVRTPDSTHLAAQLRAADPDITVTVTPPDLMEVHGVPAARIGELAAQAGFVLHELTPLAGSLEDAYMTLTQDEVEYRTDPAAVADGGAR
jgi:ABC-2 type transport system ATP-binding protein